MATIKRKSAVPIYAAAGTWVLYAALFPLYKVGHFILVAVVSAAVYLIMNAICGTQTVEVPDKPKEEKPTGNEELDKMIRDGALAISEMKRLDDAIEDAEISADIVRLEDVSQKIFDRVKEDPAKLPQIRRFMDYYLPTAASMTEKNAGSSSKSSAVIMTLQVTCTFTPCSCANATAAGISGENVDATRTKVEGMMKTIVLAFEKQLDALFGTEAMDISADISVLETMMRREGLAENGDELHAQDTASAAQVMGDIKLEL